MEFSAEKFLKNRFSKKFRGIFRGKKCTKNRPQVVKNLPKTVLSKQNKK
jgi:hypothetical protein